MASRAPLGLRSTTADNIARGAGGGGVPSAVMPMTPAKSPRHSRHPMTMRDQTGGRTSNGLSAAAANSTSHLGPAHSQRLVRQATVLSHDQALPTPAMPVPTAPPTSSNLHHHQTNHQDPNDFASLYARRALPRSPLSVDQLRTIFEKWLSEYRLNREKLSQIRAQNSQKAALWAQQRPATPSKGQYASSSPVAVPYNESASIQSLFTPAFFQSVIYTFRALLAKDPHVVSLEHLDTFVEITLYGLHMTDIQIKHACCIALREIAESPTLSQNPSMAPGGNPQPHSLLQRSVIGSILKPVTTSRNNALFGPVFDDLEIIVRQLCRSLHFALVPELCVLIQSQLDQVYTPQLLSYVRSLFFAFQCGRVALVASGGQIGTKFKQTDVNSLMAVIVQLCIYQGYSRQHHHYSASSNHMVGNSGDLGEMRVFGGALLRAIGATFPLAKTLDSVKALQPSYQVIIGEVCARVLEKNASNQEMGDEVVLKQLIHSIRNAATTPPPTNLSTFSSFIDASPDHLADLSEGTGNVFLESHRFTISFAFRACAIQNTGSSPKSNLYYQSLYDHKNTALFIPDLLVGPAKGNSDDLKRGDDMMTLSEALGDPPLSERGSSRDSVLSGVSSLRSLSSRQSEREQTDLSVSQPARTRSGTGAALGATLGQRHHRGQQSSPSTGGTAPTIIGCFSTAHPHPQTSLVNQNAAYAALDREADDLIAIYQNYKKAQEQQRSRPTGGKPSAAPALTRANFERAMSISQSLTKAMFTLSSEQLHLAKQQPGSRNPPIRSSGQVTPSRASGAQKRALALTQNHSDSQGSHRHGQFRQSENAAPFSGSSGSGIGGIRYSEQGSDRSVQLSDPAFQDSPVGFDNSTDDDDLIEHATSNRGSRESAGGIGHGYSLRSSSDGAKRQRLGF